MIKEVIPMKTQKLFLVIALIIGLLAAASAYYFSNAFTNENNENIPDNRLIIKSRCVIASRDLDRRTILSPEMLDYIEFPSELIHPDAITDINNLVGKITNDNIYKGEVILELNIRDKDTTSELGFVLPEDKRAITVGSTVTSGVGNMINPGDHVDILVYLTEKIAGKDVSFVLLENILVLATDTDIIGNNKSGSILSANPNNSGSNNKPYQSVTLAASPDDCVKLNLAESIGRIKMVLHNPKNDNSTGDEKHFALAESFSKEAGIKIKSNISNNITSRNINNRKVTDETEIRVEKISEKKTEKSASPKIIYIAKGSSVEKVEIIDDKENNK